jgi:hypothetical protein
MQPKRYCTELGDTRKIYKALAIASVKPCERIAVRLRCMAKNNLQQMGYPYFRAM